MRIAYVCTDPGVPVFGRKGASIHVQEILRELLRRGAQLDLFATRLDGNVPGLAGLTVHALPWPPYATLSERGRPLLEGNAVLRTALKNAGPFDLVYERHALWASAAMEYAADNRVPGLLEVNAPLLEEQAAYRTLSNPGDARLAAGRAIGAASAVIAVSRGIADYLLREFGAGENVHVVPNGVDAERIRPGLAPSLPGLPGTFTIGFVGTLKPWHDLETLARAFSIFRERHERARLLVVGDGPQRATLERCLESSGVKGSTRFAGAVDAAAIPRLLASMDVGVAPYPQMEGFYFSPLKLFEYMAAGLPVVGSDIGQVAEVIDHDQTGLLVLPGDAPALAAALDRLAGDASLRGRLGSAARESAVHNHTWKSVTSRILDLARDSHVSVGTRRAV